jgi:hypothetical protein
MRAAGLRRLRGKADAAWREVVRAVAERVLVLRFRIGDQNRSPLEWLTAA